MPGSVPSPIPLLCALSNDFVLILQMRQPRCFSIDLIFIAHVDQTISTAVETSSRMILGRSCDLTANHLSRMGCSRLVASLWGRKPARVTSRQASTPAGFGRDRLWRQTRKLGNPLQALDNLRDSTDALGNIRHQVRKSNHYVG